MSLTPSSFTPSSLTPSYLTSGAFTKIFVDMDTVSSMLARLLSNLDEFPDPTASTAPSTPGSVRQHITHISARTRCSTTANKSAKPLRR
jgi:hypothetical protein